MAHQWLTPDHIPRMEVELSPGADACADCGRRLRRIGEDGEPLSAIGPRTMASEELEYVPGRFIVNKIVRPRLTCSWLANGSSRLHCRLDRSSVAAPARVSSPMCCRAKYADHLPLYRQSQIFNREGIDLDRSTLADWVGKSTTLLEPLADAIGRHVLSAEAIFADGEPCRAIGPSDNGEPGAHAGAGHRQDPDRAALDLRPR
jgi:transposase